MNDPLISVIIPVYNGDSFLEETLQSFLAQTYKNFELICIDDSSTDSSYQILKNYAKLDDRIKVCQKENGGYASISIEYGINIAKGDYCMYSSQDDIVSENLFEEAISLIKEKDADVVIPDMVYFGGDKSDLSRGIFWQETVPNPDDMNGLKAFKLSLFWGIHGFGIFKMSIVREVGIDTFNFNSDEYTLRRRLLKCQRIYFSKGIFFYRQNNENAITKKISIKLYDSLETNLYIDKLAKDNNIDNETLRSLHEGFIIEISRLLLKLYMQGHNLSAHDYKLALQKLEHAYYSVDDRKNLFHDKPILQLFLTKNYTILKIFTILRLIKLKISGSKTK